MAAKSSFLNRNTSSQKLKAAFRFPIHDSTSFEIVKIARSYSVSPNFVLPLNRKSIKQPTYCNSLHYSKTNVLINQYRQNSSSPDKLVKFYEHLDDSLGYTDTQYEPEEIVKEYNEIYHNDVTKERYPEFARFKMNFEGALGRRKAPPDHVKSYFVRFSKFNTFHGNFRITFSNSVYEEYPDCTSAEFSAYASIVRSISNNQLDMMIPFLRVLGPNLPILIFEILIYHDIMNYRSTQHYSFENILYDFKLTGKPYSMCMCEMIIIGYARCVSLEYLVEVLSFYMENYKVTPKVIIYALEAIYDHKQYELAARFFFQYEKLSQFVVHSYSFKFKLLLSLGYEKLALNILNHLIFIGEASVKNFSVFFSFYLENKKYKEICNLILKMRSHGFYPNSIMYRHLLQHVDGDAANSLRLYEVMKVQKLFKDESFIILISSLTKSNNIQKAEKIIEESEYFKPNQAYHTILREYVNRNDIPNIIRMIERIYVKSEGFENLHISHARLCYYAALISSCFDYAHILFLKHNLQSIVPLRCLVAPNQNPEIPILGPKKNTTTLFNDIATYTKMKETAIHSSLSDA